MSAFALHIVWRTRMSALRQCFPMLTARVFVPLRLCVTALLLMYLPLQAGPRDAQWKLVEAAIQQGLPQTAVTNLEPIILGALKDKAYAEAVKAIDAFIQKHDTLFYDE